jgi:DGQHR domain-containing protein
MKKNVICVRTLRICQDGDTPLFSFCLRARDILRIADISRINKGSTGELLGYQRGEVSRHVAEIVAYLDKEKVLFPNAIILAMSSRVKFTQSRGPQIGDPACLPGVLTIPLGDTPHKAAWIVDGQQRTLALSQSKRTDLLVPITAFVSDDFEVHRTQFLLVNKVQPLPNSLINELLPEVNTALPPTLARNRAPSALCNILNKDPDSPFKGLIIRETTDRNQDRSAVVKDTSLIQVIRTSLNSPHGCLYQYRNVATGEVDFDAVRPALNLYWSAVKDTFPHAWGKPSSESRLMHGVGIKAMGIVMDRIMCTFALRASDAGEKVRATLERLKPYCAWTEGNWVLLNNLPWNQLQNTSGDVRLLANMLARALAGECELK